MIVSRKPSLGVFALLLLALTLGGCAQQIRQANPDARPTPASSPSQAIAAGDYARAADLYMRAASNQSDPERSRRLRFEAGLAAAQAGNTTMARQILDSFTPSTLERGDRGRYELAQREISIAGLPPSQALDRLPPPSSGTAPAIAERVWEKRAQLHFEQNDLIAGIGALVQRGVWLVDDQMLRGNDSTIYDKALDAISMGQGPQSSAARDADKTTLGWLALADIGQRRWSSRNERDRALASWEERFAQHPATRAVLENRFSYRASTSPAQREPGQRAFGETPRPQSDTVALALPLTGKFENAAKAIRDGFMFAYENDDTAPSRPMIYDTNTMTATDVQRQAQSDRVGILVGPLDKPKVAEMARLDSRIPTIGLNYSDTPNQRPGFYQFALSPEDEAREVARHAADEGHRGALALVPSGGWGTRVFDAFREAFEQRGGQLINYANYEPSEPDHRDPIQSVLRNRAGADFIFVAGQPDQARLIRSQLRYYRARNLKMFTTSHAYTGTPNAGDDIDLNGVGFADMPWVVGQGDFLENRRAEAEQRYGTTAKHYKRLFAMGMDAWRLTDRIAEQGLASGDVFEGMSGVLKVNQDGTIRRYLAWAVFRSGEPQLVEMPSMNDARSDSSRAAPDPWAQR
ncbi:LppC lipoprotein [Salinisphaera dokdonensis CL-ES53]|uniref:LppC lipoprotein n=1 Tax=Salinisphaera dokdonensis CL-ES53 TaxID=1304272 RepID=A0ABV2AXC9_9GAMM